MKVTIAITGASGSIYGKTLLERLATNNSVEKINLVLSNNALGVIQHEISSSWLDSLPSKVTILKNNDFYTSIASGSSCDDVMVIVPCSAGEMGRIANGISDTLITRASDVILKERKKLILVLRETPYSLIHIENMKSITLAGGIILPATPSFYNNGNSIDAIILSVVERIEKQIGIDSNSYKWCDSK